MKPQASILLIEDHRDIAEIVGDFLESKGYLVDYAADGLTGLHLAVTQVFDVIVLDLSLPGMDGVSLCEQLRNQAKLDTPIIMLTARDTLQDKITGLNVGADDYLVKPFSVLELEARIRAQLRRYSEQLTPQPLQVGDLVFDKATYRVLRAGYPIKLTPTALRILEVLMRASPAVVSRQELERQVWGDALTDSDSLRSHMYMLRKQIDKPFATALLKNLPGNGYQLISET